MAERRTKRRPREQGWLEGGLLVTACTVLCQTRELGVKEWPGGGGFPGWRLVLQYQTLVIEAEVVLHWFCTPRCTIMEPKKKEAKGPWKPTQKRPALGRSVNID